MSVDTAPKTAGPGFIIRIACRPFIRVAHTQFVGRVEVVIDLGVDLLAAETGQGGDSTIIGSKYGLGAAALVAAPPIARGIQTIAENLGGHTGIHDGLVVVRQRHLGQDLCNKSCRIHSCAIGIPG